MMTGKQILWRTGGGEPAAARRRRACVGARPEPDLSRCAGGGWVIPPIPTCGWMASAAASPGSRPIGFHGWGNERSNSNISAYVENSSYFRRSATGSSSPQRGQPPGERKGSRVWKPRLQRRLRRAAELALLWPNRLTRSGRPGGSTNVGDRRDPDLLALTQRQYRVNGTVGASYVLSPRDSLDRHDWRAARVVQGRRSGNGDLLD
jgi:hypothetical protein